MPKSENQKLKILYVAKYLLENSDENNYVRTVDIVDYLVTECDISAERRSIYRDINILRDVFGMDIVNGHKNKYKLMSRKFEFDDLRLLAQCVYAAKFISKNQAETIIDTLGKFCSVYQAEDLKADVLLEDRVKSKQKGTMQIISNINAAMAKKQYSKPHTPQKISFKYLKYSIGNMQQVERRKGDTYIVSPYKLIINDGNYYLLAFADKEQKFRTYRIDRMKDLKLLDEPRAGEDFFKEIDLTTYTRRTFGMYGGTKEKVTMRFIKPILDTVVDRFGTDVIYMKDDDNHFKVVADVEVSPQFFGRICGFGNRAVIESPQNVVDDFQKHIEKIQSKY